MVPALCANTAAVLPPSYQRALRKQPAALHVTALVLVTTLHLLDLCRLAVRLAHRRCPPPLPNGPRGKPRTYSEESLLLIALLRTLLAALLSGHARLAVRVAGTGAGLRPPP